MSESKLVWKERMGHGVFAVSQHGRNYILIGTVESEWRATLQGNVSRPPSNIAHGTLLGCIQACQECEDKLPELEPGWYWYREAGQPPEMARVETSGYKCVFGSQTRNYSPDFKLPGTFHGPIELEDIR